MVEYVQRNTHVTYRTLLDVQCYCTTRWLYWVCVCVQSEYHVSAEIARLLLKEHRPFYSNSIRVNLLYAYMYAQICCRYSAINPPDPSGAI